MNLNKHASELLDDQRRRWLRGETHLVEQYLDEDPSLASDNEVVVDLIYQEFVLRSEREGRPDAEEYLRRFPRYWAQLEPQLNFLRAVQSVTAKMTWAPRAAAATQVGRVSNLEIATHETDAARSRWPRVDGYEITAELGQGSMGVVYKAWEHDLQRVVALKMIHPARAQETQARERFRIEAESVARLQHPHIVQIFQIGEQDGRPFFAMEFVQGVTLEHQLKKGPLAPQQAAQLMELLARAVDYAHSRGIVHRDLKPANIMLPPSGDGDGAALHRSDAQISEDFWSKAKITDFSLARQLDGSGPHHTEAGVILGTPAYMAPEQAAGAAMSVGPLADVYGLGAIFYELLTGRPPFLAQTHQETLLQAKENEALLPSRLQPKVSRDLDTICLHCLEKEPGGRYASAQELADDLGRYQRGEAIKARPLGMAGRVWRFCLRRPALAGSTMTLVLALAVGFVSTFSQWLRAETALGDAEAARIDAEQNEAQAQELLGEIIRSFGVVRHKEHLTAGQVNLARLFDIESQCERLLEKRPGDLRLRIALTRVRAGLADIHNDRAELPEAETYLQRASQLWEPLVLQDPGNPAYRIWLAITCNWQAFSACGRGSVLEGLALAERSEALWLRLNDEQPDDPTILQHALENRQSLILLLDAKDAREDLLPPLRKSERILDRLVRENPADRMLCQRLALVRLLLGEAHFKVYELADATFYWRQAAMIYGRLDPQRRNLLVQLPLAFCCSRLIRGSSNQRAYQEAVAAFERAGTALAMLVDQNADSTWHQHALLQTRLSLALCHLKVGEPARAQQLYRSQLTELDRLLRTPSIETVEKIHMLKDLIDVAVALREAKRLEAALTVTRDAAVRAVALARQPERDLKSCEALASSILDIAALYCQVNHPSEAPPLCKIAMRLFEGLHKASPETQLYAHGLSAAWVRVAKMRWDLHQPEAALDAFRQATAIERKLFDRAPALESNRIALSRCYDRLVLWYRLNGQRDKSVAALREREKLWPRDAAKLREVAEVYRLLAMAVAERKTELGMGELAEIAGYIAERDRVERSIDLLERQITTESTLAPSSHQYLSEK